MSKRTWLVMAGLMGWGGLMAACTAQQLQQASAGAGNVVAAGQLFCAKATPTGPLVVALANDSGVPVKVTGKSSQVVADACAVIGAIPVSPPAAAATAPMVAAPVAAAAAGASP